MRKEIISNKQGISMVVTLIVGSTLVVGGASEAKQDAWISILLGMAMALPMILVYARLIKLYPNKNLFEITEEVLGKIVGKIVILLFTWYFFHLGSLVLRNVTEFVQVVSFPETPQFFVAFFIGLLIIYTIKSGIEVLGRLTDFVLPLLIFIFFITILLGTPQMQIERIKPMLYNGWKPILKGAFDLFSFPFTETAIFVVLFSSLDQKRSSPNKIFFYGLLIGGGILIFAVIRNILILGVPSISYLYFPSYSAVSIISIGDFLQRIEVIVSLTLFITCFIKSSICLLAASIGVTKLFNLDDYEKIVTPTTLLMLYLSIILYKNTMEMFEFVKYTTYYKLPFQVILPLIIWVCAEIKTGSNA